MTQDSDKKPDAAEGERIAKVMARAGLCSRRDAESWIADGRVTLNGKKLTSPAVNVQPHDVVKVDGKLLPEAEKTRLFRYHKPRGLVTTAKDPEGRPTVFQSLPEKLPRVISVGRLDLNSEGLLLLTNDGELARRLELPATGWVRRYRVRVNGRIDPATLTKLAGGIEIEGVRYGAIEAALDRQQGDNAWLTMSLTEGKNREIRKVCAHFGWTVSRLIRLSYGPFQLGHLEKGEIEEVPGKVLRDQLGQPGGAEPLRPHEARGGKARPPKQKPQSARAATPRDEHDDRVFRKHKPDDRDQRRGRSDQRPVRDHAGPRDQRVKDRPAAEYQADPRRNQSPQELAASLRSALDRASREDRAEELQQRQSRPATAKPVSGKPPRTIEPTRQDSRPPRENDSGRRDHKNHGHGKPAHGKRADWKRAGEQRTDRKRSDEARPDQKQAAAKTQGKPGKLTLSRPQSGKARPATSDTPDRRPTQAGGPARDKGTARAGGPSKGKHAHRQRRP